MHCAYTYMYGVTNSVYTRVYINERIFKILILSHQTFVFLLLYEDRSNL